MWLFILFVIDFRLLSDCQTWLDRNLWRKIFGFDCENEFLKILEIFRINCVEAKSLFTLKHFVAWFPWTFFLIDWCCFHCMSSRAYFTKILSILKRSIVSLHLELTYIKSLNRQPGPIAQVPKFYIRMGCFKLFSYILLLVLYYICYDFRIVLVTLELNCDSLNTEFLIANKLLKTFK